jgi:hypothetical protein
LTTNLHFRDDLLIVEQEAVAPGFRFESLLFPGALVLNDFVTFDLLFSVL